jgi:hypothetical protein
MALCIGVTIAGLLNVYGDNQDVVRKAESTACGGESCSVTMTRMGRTPFSQSFSFQTQRTTQKHAGAAASADVECKREFVFVGEYGCTLQGGSQP